MSFSRSTLFVVQLLITLFSISSTIAKRHKSHRHHARLYNYYLEPRSSSIGRVPATEKGCENAELPYGDYENCGVFHQCRMVSSGKYARDTFKCPGDNQFDHETRNCTDIPCSSLDPHPRIPDGWKCDRNHMKHQHPNDCRKYYVCYWTGQYYTYKIQKCFMGNDPETEFGYRNYFNERIQSCVEVDQCPQNPKVPLPDGWVCNGVGQHHPHPEDCTASYVCSRCNNGGDWCIRFRYCPPGEIFSGDKKGKCVPGTCPKKQVPEGWQCDVKGQLNVHPEDCSKYYKCLKCSDTNQGKWCYEKFVTCPNGQTFDDTNKMCVAGRCPQYPPVAPPTWGCDLEGEINVHPANCNQYYTCIQCPDSPQWCYTLQTCPPGQTFDDTNKACVTERCPQSPPLLPPEWICSAEGEKHVNPDDCSRHYECVIFAGEWSYVESQCPAGSTFDDETKKCVPGRCPQDPKELPKGWICEQDGEQRPHPDDCSQYYTCIWVEGRGKPYWSFELNQCPNGQNFDDTTDTCVVGRCPQLPPPLPAGWTCETDGTLHVHPEDCSQFYKCIKIRKNEWSYEVKKCANGKNFDDIKKACVPGRCPQWPPILPPGWTCRKNGEMRVHPTDCAQYYTCTTCPDASWCYLDLERCPKDCHFDNKKKKCVKGRCPQDPKPTPKPNPPTPPPKPGPPVPPGTSSPSGELFNCPGEGKFKDTADCRRYWQCWWNKEDGRLWVTAKQCRLLQYYNVKTKKCVVGICLLGQGY